MRARSLPAAEAGAARRLHPWRTARLSCALLVAAILGAAPAAAFRATNGVIVTAGSGGGFDVVAGAGKGAIDYWCAAGDYARRQLGNGSGASVTLARPVGPGPSGRKSIGFAVGNGGGGGGTPSTKSVGQSFSVGATMGFCEQSIARMDGDQIR